MVETDPPALGKCETKMDCPKQETGFSDCMGLVESDIPSSAAHFRKLSRLPFSFSIFNTQTPTPEWRAAPLQDY